MRFLAIVLSCSWPPPAAARQPASRSTRRRPLHPGIPPGGRDRDLDDGSRRWLDLLSPTADRDRPSSSSSDGAAGHHARRRQGARSRRSEGALPGEGYRLVVEVFIETGAARPHRDVATRHPPAAWPTRPPAVAHPRRRSARVDRRTASSVAAPREAVRRAQPGRASRSISNCACRPAMCSSRKHPKASPRSC